MLGKSKLLFVPLLSVDCNVERGRNCQSAYRLGQETVAVPSGSSSKTPVRSDSEWIRKNQQMPEHHLRGSSIPCAKDLSDLESRLTECHSCLAGKHLFRKQQRSRKMRALS